jgi:hypothetical protein
VVCAGIDADHGEYCRCNQQADRIVDAVEHGSVVGITAGIWCGCRWAAWITPGVQPVPPAVPSQPYAVRLP